MRLGGHHAGLQVEGGSGGKAVLHEVDELLVDVGGILREEHAPGELADLRAHHLRFQQGVRHAPSAGRIHGQLRQHMVQACRGFFL